MRRQLRVAVLAGGWSSEREVSLRSGAQVVEALEQSGHTAQAIDLDENTCAALGSGGFDCVFVAIHGRGGEDGRVQGMLELLGIPYTGSGVLASALSFDKTLANRLLRDAGLQVPEYEELRVTGSLDHVDVDGLAARFGYPVVVKPVREGSTIGLTIAHDIDAFASGIVDAGRYDARVIVQRFVRGVEITLGVLAVPDVRVFPTLEIVSENPVYDYDAKYTEGRSHHIIPARIPDAARDAASHAAETAFRVLGCEDLARVDIIVGDDGTPWLLEVNTVPGMTAVSLYPDGARAAGISFGELCSTLVAHAADRGGTRR